MTDPWIAEPLPYAVAGDPVSPDDESEVNDEDDDEFDDDDDEDLEDDEDEVEE